jgi:putative ATPase
MRPRTLDEYVGQSHIVGAGRLLRRAIEADQLASVIFYGPPGTGKTTLARVIANTARAHFIALNAVLAGVKDIREAIEEAQQRARQHGQRTILFVDEVHRFNKAQQDALLPWVENGTVIFVGATTENPYFEVNKALVSRSRIFQLVPLTQEDLRAIVCQALNDRERGYGALAVTVDDDALAHLVDVANGDARAVLNALELAVETTGAGRSLALPTGTSPLRSLKSRSSAGRCCTTKKATTTSTRSAPLSRACAAATPMLHSTGWPRWSTPVKRPVFSCGGCSIFAGEDVGMADPNAIQVVAACAQAFEQVGLPEGRFHLATAALYLATARKSNTAFAFFDALEQVRQEADSGVPNHLKDGSRDHEGFGHGEGYLYPHAYRDHWVAQQYLPTSLQGKVFYQPSDQGYEAGIRGEVTRRREAQLAAMLDAGRTAAGGFDALARRPGHVRAGCSAPLGGRTARPAARPGVRRCPAAQPQPGAGPQGCQRAARLGSGAPNPRRGVYALARQPPRCRGAAPACRSVSADRTSAHSGRHAGGTAPCAAQPGSRGSVSMRLSATTPCSTSPDEGLPAVCWRSCSRPPASSSLAERVPRRSQRVYALVDSQLLDPDLLRRWQAAEETIYADASDPLVNWDMEELLAALQAAGLAAEERAILTPTTSRSHLPPWRAGLPLPAVGGLPTPTAWLAG